MTAATPERPLNVEKLRRLTPKAITAIGRGDSVNVVLVPADRWPAILAALEGLWRVQAVAEDAVAALMDLGACPDPLCKDPNCDLVLPRLVAALASIPAREAEEVSGG